MSNPGILRTRLVIEAPVETPDGSGGVARSFSDVAAVWAEVVPLSARERMQAGATGVSVTHRIRIRHRDDVTTRHRLRHGTRSFRIAALRDAESTGRFLLIEAEERRA